MQLFPIVYLPPAGRDLIGVQNLMKKHQALQAELAGHEPRINNVSQQGAGMIKDGHFAADEISDKIAELEDRWQSLKVMSLNTLVNKAVGNIRHNLSDSKFILTKKKKKKIHLYWSLP